MMLSTAEIQKILGALSESLSETALTLEEIRLRINLLQSVMNSNETDACHLANITRHVLGKPFFGEQDFEF